MDFEARGLAREYHVLARNLESPLRVRVETQAEEVVIRNSVGQIIKCEIFWQWDSTCYFSAVTKMKQTYKKLSLKYLREAISLKWHSYAEVRPLKISDRVISFIRLCDFLSLYKGVLQLEASLLDSSFDIKHKKVCTCSNDVIQHSSKKECLILITHSSST